MMPIVQSCQLHDLVADVRDFEGRLATNLAIDPECKGAHFTRYSGPNGNNSGATDAMKVEGHWTLFLDYMPGSVKQAWQLNRKAPDMFTKGEGDLKEIVKIICAIVTAEVQSLTERSGHYSAFTVGLWRRHSTHHRRAWLATQTNFSNYSKYVTYIMT